MDLSDLYNQIAKLKMQGNEEPNPGRVSDLSSAGINIQRGDPRLQQGINLQNMNPDEQAKWNAYLQSLKNR